MTSILLVRPSALGDVCRTVPVLVSLRRAYPDARIDWLVRDSLMDAVKAHPDLTSAVPLQRVAFSEQLKRLTVNKFRRWLKNLAEPGYDMVFDCQGLFRSGFFAWASGAPRRVGLSNARELGWIWLNERHFAGWEHHAVDRMLMVIEQSGVKPIRDMRLYTAPEHREFVSGDPELAGKNYAVFAPTSRWPGKRWPADRFAEIIRWMLDGPRPGEPTPPRVERIVIAGTKSERADIKSLLDLSKTNPRIVDRVGSTSIGQLMALIEASTFVLANDSAAIHMAVGFDRPGIALYGPTLTHEDGPYTGHHPAQPIVVLQHLNPGETISPKDEARAVALMQRITTEEVKQAIASLKPGTVPARVLTRSSSRSPS
jgi:heptosyltransferase-1/heptosyltransferase-2